MHKQCTNFGSSTTNLFHEGPQESVLVRDICSRTSFALSPNQEPKIQQEKECFLSRDEERNIEQAYNEWVIG